MNRSIRIGTLVKAGVVVAVVGAVGASYSTLQGQELSKTPLPSQGHLVARGEGERFKPDDERIEVKISSVQSDGQFSINENHYKAGFKVVPHFHQEHVEAFYIVSGKVKWTIAGQSKVMGPGGFAYMPPDVVHDLEIVDDSVMVMIYTPGGYEYHLRREAAYTPEQLKDPVIKARLRALNDFNPVD